MQISRLGFISVCGMFCILMGCSVRVESQPTRRPSPEHGPNHRDCPPVEIDIPTDEDFQARLDAAQSIGSSITRDQALTTIALDTARYGYVAYTLKSLESMSSSISHDQASEKCADIFLRKHMFAAAKAVADKVSSTITRDQILEKIAASPVNKISR